MRKKDKCPKCGSDKQTEIISGGITITICREGEFTIKDEIRYDTSDKYSKWFCTTCGYEFKND